ncbi:tetratricopeptide repeat protein [Nannocystis sp. RBIL2]|uniref:tetratricopeptide repeat protein n=1 Tax=Nannocystis sp. RBIL2 TaxID=2996788 RepID=UPI0022709B46|nr:tetratricopeptide repeat protein [Nannocystis sp. RBIL2]MCY1064575.1 tetratricopeptide repeat protein [Nannocystis sp. RBIL2]
MPSSPQSACLGTDTLLELVEGRAAAATRARVEAHASRCEACRQLLSELASDATEAPTHDRGAPTRTPGADDTDPGELDLPLQPGARLGRYVVMSLLGAGGMGVVYAAHDPELGRPVALKLLRPHPAGPRRELEDRLRREAQAMARLSHPNVAAIHDVGQIGDRIFIAMELIRGQTLAAWLRAAPRARRDVLARFLLAGRGLAAAHAAGLVHRDFKPENVLVSDDGHVRVVDFGLARASGDEPLTITAASGTGSEQLADLTATGAVLGTPIYMAPEQHEGRPAEARSDQFSFCVALYTALYGQRPFAGDTLESLALAVRDGRLTSAPRDARVPRRLRRALLRGLSVAPADRFPTMDALLAALARDPWRRLGAAALLVGAGALAAGLVYAATAEPALCRGAARHLEGVWDGERREQVTRALTSAGAPPAAVARLAGSLDDYAARWVAMRTEACEATWLHGEQTEALLGLRTSCLDARLRELQALGERLAGADRPTAEQAVRAAQRLSDLEACADVEALTAPVRPPADPQTRQQVEALRARLAEAKAAWDAGRYRDGLAHARALIPEARALGYRPLLAEALYLEGLLADDLGQFDVAARSLEAAIWAAEASRHDVVMANALTDLMWIRAIEQADYDDLPALEARLTAALERLGRLPAREATFLSMRGRVALERGDLDAADADLQQALAIREHRFGPDDLRTLEIVFYLAGVALQRADGERALPLLERALAGQRRVYGDEHPEVAFTVETLGAALYALHRYDEAEAAYERALATYQRALGPDHHRIATVLHNLGQVHAWQGREQDELDRMRQAASLSERELGPQHPHTGDVLAGLAGALSRAGRHGEAEAMYRRALAALRTSVDPEHYWIGDALFGLGELEVELGRYEDARRSITQSLAISRKARGDGYDGADELRVLGDIEYRLGRPERSAELLAQAVAVQDPSADPGLVAWTRGLLARALYDADRDRPRALTLLDEAWRHIRADERMEEERATLEQWMKARGLRPPS